MEEEPRLYPSEEFVSGIGVKVFAIANGHPEKSTYPKLYTERIRVKQIVDHWLNVPNQSESTLYRRLKRVMTKYSPPGTNLDPHDSSLNDMFIRPYFEDDRGAVCGTLSTTIIAVKEHEIEAKEINWDFSKNKETEKTMS